MPNLIFYDLETSGLSRDFDQIFQFAAIQTDSELKEIDRIELRCRRLPWVVPSPIAMMITEITPELVDDPSLPSHFDMMCTIRDWIAARTPAVFIGYNSMRFDEPFLQRAFWQTLNPPYVTVTGGSARMDVFPLVQAASHLSPDALIIPENEKGRSSFKLDQLAPANGFAHNNAHDALADVEATIHIARLIACQVPDLWFTAAAQAPKAVTASVLQPGLPVLVMEYYRGKPALWWGQRIDKNGSRGRAASVMRLDQPWEELSSLDDAGLAEVLKASPLPVREIAQNKSPLVFSAATAQRFWSMAPSQSELKTADQLTEALANRLLKAGEESAEPWPKGEHLEQSIFEGFWSRDDEKLIQKFHSGDWDLRGKLVSQFKDERLKQLAQRAVYDNAPSRLSNSTLKNLKVSISQRLLSDEKDEAPWRTIRSAKDELAMLDAVSDQTLRAQLGGWLDRLTFPGNL